MERALAQDGVVGSSTCRMGLQDDQTFCGPVKDLSDHFAAMSAALVEAGHRLRPHRCSTWIPGWDRTWTSDLPPMARRLAELHVSM